VVHTIKRFEKINKQTTDRLAVIKRVMTEVCDINQCMKCRPTFQCTILSAINLSHNVRYKTSTNEALKYLTQRRSQRDWATVSLCSPIVINLLPSSVLKLLTIFHRCLIAKTEDRPLGELDANDIINRFVNSDFIHVVRGHYLRCYR
jgi:hypothetical protein